MYFVPANTIEISSLFFIDSLQLTQISSANTTFNFGQPVNILLELVPTTSQTPTQTPTNTTTNTLTNTLTNTPTNTPTNTLTNTLTNTPTHIVTGKQIGRAHV